MSLLRAFERNVERRMAGVPSVKIVPRYKLVAEEAAVELQKEIKTAQVKIDPDEIRRLVAESQAALLMEEVGRLRGVVSATQGHIQQMMGKFDEYKNLTFRLAEEMGTMSMVRKVNERIGAGKGHYLRDVKSVKTRWAEWRNLYMGGMTETQIANRYGVDRGTISYAKSKNWVPSWTMFSRNPKKRKATNESKQSNAR